MAAGDKGIGQPSSSSNRRYVSIKHEVSCRPHEETGLICYHESERFDYVGEQVGSDADRGRLEMLHTRPVPAGTSFEEAKARSMAFLPPDERPRGKIRILSGCGRGRGPKYFNLHSVDYPDGSGRATSYFYERLDSPGAARSTR